MKKLIAIAAFALAAACSPAAEEAPADAAEAAPAADAAAPADAAAMAEIPAEYQGVWDGMEGTCLAESDMRLAISGTEIGFYESVGTVSAVETIDTGIVVTLEMSGEGETWTEVKSLTLLEDGQVLETAVHGEEGFEPVQHKRCEG